MTVVILSQLLFFLHRVHETLLYLVENDDAYPEKDNHEHKAIDKPAPTDEFSTTQCSVFEGFNNRCNGIKAHEFMYRDPEILHTLGLAEGIYDRSGVHPELDQEREKDLQVAILGGQGRDDCTKSEGQACHHQYKDRE